MRGLLLRRDGLPLFFGRLFFLRSKYRRFAEVFLFRLLRLTEIYIKAFQLYSELLGNVAVHSRNDLFDILLGRQLFLIFKHGRNALDKLDVQAVTLEKLVFENKNVFLH